MYKFAIGKCETAAMSRAPGKLQIGSAPKLMSMPTPGGCNQGPKPENAAEESISYRKLGCGHMSASCLASRLSFMPPAIFLPIS